MHKTKQSKPTFISRLKISLNSKDLHQLWQCWTEGRKSTAVAEDLRPTAMATVAEV